MTGYTHVLIQHVVNNDLKRARETAKGILESNTVQKDKAFCEEMLAKMKAQESGIEIPYNLKSIIRTECTPYGFRPERYYLPQREAKLLEHIKRMYGAGERMSEMGIHYANAILLHGASGTGKTTFARYVADALNLPFLYVSITQMMDSLLGKTGQNLDLVFKFAETIPCVLVLDEIDQIGTKRGDDMGTSGEMKRVLITIMQNLDRLPNNVVLIAATNRVEAIDPALMRRFTVKHDVWSLSDEEATCFVSMYLSKLGLQWSGEIYPFLSFAVAPKQAVEIEMGRYAPAVVVDCLNERIAQAIERNEGDIVVSLQ